MRSKVKPQPSLHIKQTCYRAWKGAGRMLRQQQGRQWWLLLEKKLLPVRALTQPVQLLAQLSPSLWEQLPGITGSNMPSGCFQRSRLPFFLDS